MPAAGARVCVLSNSHNQYTGVCSDRTKNFKLGFSAGASPCYDTGARTVDPNVTRVLRPHVLRNLSPEAVSTRFEV